MCYLTSLHGISALLVQLIDSKTGCSTNGNGVTLFSCIGCSVVIKCALNKIKSDPVWSRNGKPISTHGDRLHAAKENKLNLHISDLVTSDTAKYCCLAITDKNISEQYCTMLEIIELQILPSETIVGTNGSTINVTCSLKNNIPGEKKISWIRNGKLVSSNTSNIITVTFLLNTNIHQQNLKCKADFDCIDMPLEQDVKFNVTYRPSVKVMALPSSTINEMDNVSLTCTYDSNPYPRSITWTKNSKNVSHDDTYKMLNISRLDNGLYACNVFNSIGNGVAKVHITVLYAPDVSVVQFLNGSLYCNATGVPMNYTISKWEHQSFNGQHLRYLNAESSTITVDLDDDILVYELDGRYLCTVTNGIPDSHKVLLQTGYKDVYWPERPYCANSKPDPQYVQQKENVTLVFHVYSYILSSYQWSKEDEKLNQSLKHQFSSRSSRFEVNIFGRDVQIETIMIYLEIVNVTKKDLDAAYILKVYNPYGNKICIIKLQEGSTPEKPNDFDVKPHGNGFKISWISRFNGGYHQNFIIKYRYVLDAIWTTKNVTSHRFNNTYTELIQGILKNKEYIIYMYAENVIGMSGFTDLVSVNTNSVRNKEPENNIFNNISEKLLISLTSTLLVIVTFILCCLFARNYRKNMILSQSARNQVYTVNTNGHYEEIDGALEMNIDNSLSPGNQIELTEMREAEQSLVLLQNSIQTIKETVDVAMRDISKQALRETITQVIKDTQLEMIRGALRQVLIENSDSQLLKRRSSASSESGPDAYKENQETEYLNPYQPLHIDGDSCEHPYMETTLNEASLDICSGETKKYPIDVSSLCSENIVLDL